MILSADEPEKKARWRNPSFPLRLGRHESCSKLQNFVEKHTVAVQVMNLFNAKVMSHFYKKRQKPVSLPRFLVKGALK